MITSNYYLKLLLQMIISNYYLKLEYFYLLFMDFYFWKNIQGHRLGRNIKPKPWQSRNLQLTKQ